jgi:hypothetical protein
LHELFVRCVAAATEELPELSSTNDIEQCLLGLRDLFRAFSGPGNREVAGLWAELFVIARSGDIPLAITRWHNDPLDRYDFSGGSLYLEVKSTTRSIRAQSFSLEQLVPPKDGDGLVASLLLQPLTGGIGILDLARRIDTAIEGKAKLRVKLWRNVALAVGSDFCESLDRAFDESFADRHVVVYAMSDVPRPDFPLDPRITAVRFTVDLSDVRSSLLINSGEAIRNVFVQSPENAAN